MSNRYSTANATDRANLLAAYNVTNETEFRAAVADYDPLLYPTALWDGRNALIQYATGDTTVPYNINAVPWLNRFSPALAVSRYQESVGGDHNTVTNDPTQIAATISFLNDMNVPYIPPPAVQGKKVTMVRAYLDGEWSEVLVK